MRGAPKRVRISERREITMASLRVRNTDKCYEQEAHTHADNNKKKTEKKKHCTHRNHNRTWTAAHKQKPRMYVRQAHERVEMPVVCSCR